MANKKHVNNSLLALPEVAVGPESFAVQRLLVLGLKGLGKAGRVRPRSLSPKNELAPRHLPASRRRTAAPAGAFGKWPRPLVIWHLLAGVDGDAQMEEMSPPPLQYRCSRQIIWIHWMNTSLRRSFQVVTVKPEMVNLYRLCTLY